MTNAETERLSFVERAQPWLGTIVSIGVGGLDDTNSHAAIEAGFAAIKNVHSAMSFHEHTSDVSRLNMHAHERIIAVDPHTYAVIAHAVDLSRSSNGVFDIAVGAKLVTWNFLPQQNILPPITASWRDIELLPPQSIRFRQPLWIDLGGIAKGYAVDQAAETLRQHGVNEGRVNAGGDIRIFGPHTHHVMLRVPEHSSVNVPVLEVSNCALASSSNATTQRQFGDRMVGPHLNGVSKEPVGFGTFVTVVAETCVIADALTKVVLALGEGAHDILVHHKATAYVHAVGQGWQTFGIEM